MAMPYGSPTRLQTNIQSYSFQRVLALFLCLATISPRCFRALEAWLSWLLFYISFSA